MSSALFRLYSKGAAVFCPQTFAENDMLYFAKQSLIRLLTCAAVCGGLMVPCVVNAATTNNWPTGTLQLPMIIAAPVSAAPQAPLPVVTSATWKEEHDRAVQLARQGRYGEALPTLKQLYVQHGDDVSVVRDYLAVLGWAGGNDALVVNLYRTLPPDQPDYVLSAVGLAYRNLHQPRESYRVYQIGLTRAPYNVGFATGAIRSLTEDGYLAQALAFADDNLYRLGQREEILLAAAEAADKYDRSYQAMHYYRYAVLVDPNNKQAWSGLIHTADHLGAPHLALKLADQHPGMISPEEYRRIAGNDAAALVRWGTTIPAKESERFAATDQAIARLNALIDKWSQEGDKARDDILRARYDRMVAMRNRFMMKEVIAEYESMLQEGVTPPSYVLGSVAEAYLYMRQPETARDLYLRALEAQPKDYDVRKQLFYAYVDCDDFDKAFQVIDTLASEQSEMLQQAGSNQMVPNPRRANAELIAGAGRLYADQVAEAEKRIMPVVNAAPNQPSNREALGNLYNAHGWPRLAQQQYQIGTNLKQGKDVNNEIGLASTYLELQNFQAAENETQSLIQRFPENLGVQRTEHALQVYNMAELRVRAGYDFSPMTDDKVAQVVGGRGYGIDTMLYSPPIDYNWRLFAGEFWTHQHEPNNEGSISFSRSTAGVEYRNGDLTTNLAPTYNHYHGTDRVGFDGDATYWLSDQWAVAGSGELFAEGTPLRALNSGVTANAYTAHVLWRQSEGRQLRIGGDVMPFSDGNLRSGVDASFTQRLYTIPHFHVDGLVDAGESQNSKDENRFYYNPNIDAIGLLGLRATQVLYQRYSTVYTHSLQIQPGAYWQDFYGSSAVLRMRYEQRVLLNDTFQAGAGINFSRQAYDGTSENDVRLTLDLTERF